MKLKDLLINCKPIQIQGNEDVEITAVDIDSRKVGKGGLFVAMKGTQTDGHQFIEKAIGLGAVAVLCEDMPEHQLPTVTYVQLPSTEEAVGEVATRFYGDPSHRLKLIGVTELYRRRGNSCQPYHPRCHRTEQIAGAHGRGRMRICLYGMFFTRHSPASHRWTAFHGWTLYQSDA